MKELPIEEKAKAYDDALERAKKYLGDCMLTRQEYAEKVFPELAESEGERIRKALVKYFISNISNPDYKICGVSFKEVLAWFEKQGGQDNVEDVDILQRFSFYSYKDEPNVLYLSGLYVNEECRNKGIGTKILEVADEVAKSLNCHAIRLKTKKNSNAERLYRAHGYNSLATEERDGIWLEKKSEQKAEPKFHEGEWVVTDKNSVVQIKAIEDSKYVLENTMRFTIDYVDKCWRKWTIQDAKDGDVLYSIGFHNDCIFIFNGLDNWRFDEPNGEKAVATGYCCLSILADKMEFGMQGPDCIEVNTVKPATKIQRNILFQKMKEAGCEWDIKKKELKKIEQKQAVDYPDNLPKDNWELIHEFVKKFGRIPKDEDELNALVKYVLKKQNPWSEEDKKMLDDIIEASTHHCYLNITDINWLKSLKERIQLQPKQEWKPNEAQLAELYYASNGVHYNRTTLLSLLEQLKKLKD